MIRRRWLRAQWPFGTRVLSDRLKELQFTSEAQNGFIVDRLRSNRIEGRFVERQEISQTVESPLGETILYERIEFRETAFIVAPDRLGLEIINPPRSMSLFLSRLAEACDFQVAVTEIRVDVTLWCERLSANLGKQLDIISCQLRDIKLTENITATAVLKGSSDVRQATRLLTDGMPYINDKIKIQVQGSPSQSLILTRHGSATLDRIASESLLDPLRDALYSAAG
ncbi:hypothetical protein [Microvirga rosea]|uniref:hypothetical protein n=1 Tax=Microvirga rosea TaxID=2715425 RepID=UPI001D09DB38|nr:hypothetical protein [Microvirga rosea]MCB8823289.1 hypothetical protein [Microvirga rosea]